ncbi:hypothetical protein BJ138DRAFT_1130823 [Hygrophoropsis aurantiaca]|uniref:Uncharacterized protein n=1 Tax=Hygrophoropsis aurantiaca TaxID=72124 RepID=A0ACB7ZVT0_9AGAM|nr:hypothetical protein BJ138DRAFT_1130823 [Hygrophoropsis aurantiaca]
MWILGYHMTLMPTGALYDMMHLPQFLSLSPRIEYLRLDLWWQPPDIIFEIVPLTPCLTTLQISFQELPDASEINAIFEAFGHDGTSTSSTSTLPKLQHFKLDVLQTPRTHRPPLAYDAEKLLRMLGSRCKPNPNQLRLGDHTVAVLRTFVMNQSDFHTGILVDLPPWPWEIEVKQRLEALREQGLALGGNILMTLLDSGSFAQS